MDLVAESAAELQERLSCGSFTSVELVKICLKQIDKYDRKGPKLRAMISVASEAKSIEHASLLDSARAAGRVLGLLHGIPIIIKVQVET